METRHDSPQQRASTEVAALVSALVARGCQERVFEGNAWEVLRDDRSIWLVSAGSVDLFVVALRDGAPAGRRRQIARVRCGDVIPEIAPIARGDARVGVLAVGVVGARVVKAPWASFWVALEAQRNALGGRLLETWCDTLSAMVAAERPEQDLLPLDAGDTLLSAGACAVTRGNRLLWLSVTRGSVQWLGRRALEPGDSVWPLPASAWVRAVGGPAREEAAPEGATLRLQTTADVFAEVTNAPTILAPVHAFVLAACGAASEEARAAQSLELDRRVESQAQRIHLALTALGGQAPAMHADVGVTASGPRSHVEQVFRYVALDQGFTVRVPPGAPSTLTLRRLARASLVPLRDVVLSAQWWADGIEPMVAHRQAGGVPVALLPRPGGGYFIWDPSTGRRERVTAKIADTLEAAAHSLSVPLPSSSITPLGLLRFATHGSRGDLARLVLATLALSGLGALTPLAFGSFVDHVLPGARVEGLVQLGAMLVCAAIATSLVQFAHDLQTLRLQSKLTARLQAATWSRLVSLPAPFFRKFTSGDLAQRANSIESIRELLSHGLLSGLLHGLSGLGYVAIMLAYDLKLAALGVGAAVINGVLVGVFTARSVRLRRSLSRLGGELVGMLLQYVNAVTKLRVAGAEPLAYERWAYRFAARRDVATAVFDNENAFALFGGIFPSLAMAALFTAAGARPRGELDVGAFVGFFTAFSAFTAGVAELVRLAASLFDVVPLLERASPIFEERPEHDPSRHIPSALCGRIELARLTFRYDPKGPPTLSEIDLAIEPGEFVAIVGPSGSGKSTLLRLLLGFERPEAGGVYFDGQDLATLDVSEVRRQIGVVLQGGELEPTDIFRNIVGTRNLTLDDAWAAARVAGLEDDIRAMPMGMHTIIGHSLSLSGGQRQRLFIARAVAAHPRMLFLDEATSALDAATQHAVMEALDTFKATRVVIAHRLSTVRNADRIVVVEGGHIVQTGTFDALIGQPGPFRNLAERQIT